MDWLRVGPQGCCLAWAQEAGKWESDLGPSQADQVEKPPHGGLRALWLPDL